MTLNDLNPLFLTALHHALFTLPRLLQGPCRLAAWARHLFWSGVGNLCPAVSLLGSDEQHERCDRCWREPGKRGGPADESKKINNEFRVLICMLG